jgi:hypothetical protein
LIWVFSALVGTALQHRAALLHRIQFVALLATVGMTGTFKGGINTTVAGTYATAVLSLCVPKRTDTNFETPASCMVTPYIA